MNIVSSPAEVYVADASGAWVPAGWTDLVDTDDAPAPQPIPPQIAGHLTASWHDVEAPLLRVLGVDFAEAMTHSVTYTARRPVPLLTGRRDGRRRVDHARQLRMATWARRRQRRHGTPAATVTTHVTIPRATVDLEVGSS